MNIRPEYLSKYHIFRVALLLAAQPMPAQAEGADILIEPASARSAVAATPQSTLNLPLELPLTSLAALLHAELPEVLHKAGPRRQTCIPAKRACTDIPEFHGFNIKMVPECVDITPRISCDITERIVREGPPVITGSGNRITLRQRISGSATVQGTGDLGKHIQETARARAELIVSINPKLARDWSLLSDVDISYQWINRPQVKLFNLFEITFAGKVEPELNKAIARFTPQMRDEIAKLPIRAKVAELWAELQKPMVVDIPGNAQDIHISFRPEAIGFSGLEISDNTFRSAFSLSGHLAASPDPDSSPMTTLPPLGEVAATQSGFRINLPAFFGWDQINSALAEQLPANIPVDEPKGPRGTINVTSANVSSESGRLRIETELSIRLEDLPMAIRLARLGNFSGRVLIEGTPVYDLSGQRLHLSAANVTLPDNPGLETILKFATRTGGSVSDQLSQVLSVSLSSQLSKLEANLQAQLNRNLGSGLEMAGTLALGAPTVGISQSGLQLSLTAEGDLRLQGKMAP